MVALLLTAKTVHRISTVVFQFVAFVQRALVWLSDWLSEILHLLLMFLYCIFVDINTNYLNGRNRVEFSLGFRMDGYKEYRDLTKSKDSKVKALARLFVYEDPNIKTFKESTGDETLVSMILV